MLVRRVVNGGVSLARALALGLNLDNIVAASETFSSNVMSALGHGVVETEFIITEVTTGNNTSTVEPSPRGTNLTTVAAHGLAVNEVAASSGICDGQKSGESTLSGDADTVIESLGGAVGPA